MNDREARRAAKLRDATPHVTNPAMVSASRRAVAARWLVACSWLAAAALVAWAGADIVGPIAWKICGALVLVAVGGVRPLLSIFVDGLGEHPPWHWFTNKE